MRVSDDQVRWAGGSGMVPGWWCPAWLTPASEQGRLRGGWGQSQYRASFSSSSLLVSYYLCLTYFTSFSSHSTSLAPWDLWLSSKRKLTEYLSFPLSNCLVDFPSYSFLLSLSDIHRFLGCFPFLGSSSLAQVIFSSPLLFEVISFDKFCSWFKPT